VSTEKFFQQVTTFKLEENAKKSKANMNNRINFLIHSRVKGRQRQIVRVRGKLSKALYSHFLLF
jgi:hypothetical protein